MEEDYTSFNTLNKRNIGDKFNFRGKVEVIRQTSGPTLIIINDGTQGFTFKAFVKPGVRAYPEINEGDYVKGTAIIYERNDDIEGEVIDMQKMSSEDIETFNNDFKNKIEENIKPKNTEFTHNSEVLNSLRNNFIKVASIIRRAVYENRPIILRHNADCDGYVSAITLEKAIIELIKEVYGTENNLEFLNYKRAPSKAPFYEYDDAIKDLIGILLQQNRINSKPPLIIITDNGSTEEDLLSIKQMKIYDCQIVVIDHHFPGEVKNGRVLVDEHIDGHINPYLKGFDSNTSAGMLGFELARFVNDKVELPFYLPAVSGVADHSERKYYEFYLEKAKEEGFSEEYLRKLAEVIDAEIYYVKFSEARELIQDLFFNIQKQKKIVDLLFPDLEKRYKKLEPVIEKYSEIIELKDYRLILLNGEKAVFRGEYPAIGKTTNFIHRYFEKKFNKPIICGVYGSFFLTIRVSDKVKNFSVPEFVKYIEKKYKYINPSGGGHEHAGSVKFIEYGQKEVLECLKDYINNL